jgi:hypothetical protein
MKPDQLTRTIEIKNRNGRVTGTKEVVTYQGLLSKAHEGLVSIETSPIQIPSDENRRTVIDRTTSSVKHALQSWGISATMAPPSSESKSRSASRPSVPRSSSSSQELHARSRELGLQVIEIYPAAAREKVAGNPHATKLDIARMLTARFPELQRRLPFAPPHPVLGFRPRDRYWLHLFDALAVAVAISS